MTCNLRIENSSLPTVKNFTDRKEIAPLYDFTSRAKNILSAANDEWLSNRKHFLTDR